MVKRIYQSVETHIPMVKRIYQSVETHIPMVKRIYQSVEMHIPSVERIYRNPGTRFRELCGMDAGGLETVIYIRKVRTPSIPQATLVGEKLLGSDGAIQRTYVRLH